MKNVFEIAMLVPGMMFDGRTLETRSLGGSETAALCLAREFARAGHNVWVFNNCVGPDVQPGLYDGVVYAPYEQWGQFATRVPFDLAIIQRLPEAFGSALNSKFNVLWCHDLALGRTAGKFRSVLWNLDAVAVVSAFMREQYRKVYGGREDLYFTTRNGIDLDLFPKPGEVERRRKTIVYGARPERGLDVLLGQIMPRLLRTDPDIRLQLATYDNAAPGLEVFYRQCIALAQALPAGTVENLGHLPKRDYYRHLASAGVYVYPTPSPIAPTFREVSCISAMEAQAAGTPVVSFAQGALPETLDPGAGCLVPGLPSDEGAIDRFVAEVQRRIYDGSLHDRESSAGLAAASRMTWQGIAADWLAKLEEMFRRDNADEHRLVTWFVKRSDVEAVRAVRDRTADEKLRDDLDTYLRDSYGFTATPEAFRAHYRAHGEETTTRLRGMAEPALRSLATETRETRYHVLRDFLVEHPGMGYVLDFGCGHGWSTVYLHNQVGRRWLGVDVDPGAIEWSRDYAGRFANAPADLAFLEGDHTALPTAPTFDGAIVSEVLEHVLEPYETLEAIERSVRPGGWIIATLPSGPVEFGTWNWLYFRNHIREWTGQDIRDVFGGKKAIVNFVAESRNDITNDPQGFHVIRWEADPSRPFGRVDMERKLHYQRPRETLSAIVIAGGPRAEEHLHSMLRSIRMVTDEIVVADCGLSAEARRILALYPVKVVPGKDPKVHGFEEARNLVLDQATCDWVLWIDTDETLTNAPALPKYLRWNVYDGYSLLQHHFATDTRFRPDMPVRLFRRVLHDGARLRFFGAIHEHPERELNKGPGEVVALSDVSIGHPGYYHENERRERFYRNAPLMELDRRRYPDRLLHKHFTCRDNVIAVSHEAQANGAVLTEEMRAKLEEVVRIAQDSFIGKDTYYGIDFLEYYSQANTMLGRGFNARLDVVMERDGQAIVRQEGQFREAGNQYRFACQADLEAELAKLARQARQFDQEYW